MPITKPSWLLNAEANKYIAWHEEGNCWINLHGDYDYLELPYFISQEYELAGKVVRPTCKEMLDAYVPPLFLERAKMAGLPVTEFYISNGYFEPPVILDPINPFMLKSRIVRTAQRRDAIARSMTRNYTYAVCCQEIPEGARIVRFRSILGQTSRRQFQEAASSIWEMFHIPLATVRMILCSDGRQLYSDIAPLLYSSLTTDERSIIDGRVQWQR